MTAARPPRVGRRTLLAGLAAALGAALLVALFLAGPRAPAAADLLPSYGSFAPSEVTPVDLSDVLASGGRPLPLRVVGRAAPAGDAPSGVRHQWPGIYVEARFDGPSVVAAFDDDAHRYRIVVDGQRMHVVDRPGQQGVLLDGLGPGPHHVRLEKLNESFSETGIFRGFFVPETGAALDPPAARPLQFEFIGDSDMAGFGVTSETRDCSGEEVRLATDTHQTYGALVARHYGADYRINALSGIGLVRNYEGADPEWPMSKRYPRVLKDEATPPEDPGWSPDLIAIALGGNDFGTAFVPGERWTALRDLRPDFEAAYLRLLASLRERHPGAHLLLVVMEGYDRLYETAHEAVAADFRSRGGEGIGVLRFPELALTACGWHPSRADHAAMAEALVAYIDAHLDL